MRILLPPSETKYPGGRGRPLDRRDPHPTLGATRNEVLDALERALARPDAADALLLPAAVRADALAANARARTCADRRCAAALRGGRVRGLGYETLPLDVQRLAHRSVLVFSGLFGVVRGDEPIPPYRVPAKSVLPGVGVAGTFWRRTLDSALPPLLGRGLVVDLRSTDYAAMWRPDAQLARRVVTVRVLSPTPSGRLAVVSFASKLAKGRLAAALLQRAAGGEPVRSAADVAAAWDGPASVDGSVVVLHAPATAR